MDGQCQENYVHKQHTLQTRATIEFDLNLIGVLTFALFLPSLSLDTH